MANSKAVFSWSRGSNGAAIVFGVRYKIGNGSYKFATTSNTIFEIDNLKPLSVVTFQVRAEGVAPNNKTSKYVSTVVTIPKQSVPTTASPVAQPILLPPDPISVTVEASTKNEAILKFSIDPTYAGNKEELVAVIRHSSKTDGTGVWQGSTFLRTVSATTDYVMLPLLNGEYLVKFRDLENNKSTNAVSAVMS